MQRFHALLIQYLRSFVIVAGSQRLACKWMCESQRKYARCQINLFDQRFKIIPFNGNSWGCRLQRINTINAIRGACVCVCVSPCVFVMTGTKGFRWIFYVPKITTVSERAQFHGQRVAEYLWHHFERFSYDAWRIARFQSEHFPEHLSPIWRQWITATNFIASIAWHRRAIIVVSNTQRFSPFDSFVCAKVTIRLQCQQQGFRRCAILWWICQAYSKGSSLQLCVDYL